MFFRKWLSRSRKPSAKSVGRRRNRREAWFVQQAIYSGLGVEALESRQLLSATVLATSTQQPPALAAGQVASPVLPAVTPVVTPTAPPAQTPAADLANQISVNAALAAGNTQTNTIEPAITPSVAPVVPSLAGVGGTSPPSVNLPPTGTLNENSSLSFSNANGDAISITDAAAGTNADSLTLSVSQGTLTLASTTGLSFTAGANGSASFTVSGTVTDLDSALDGLVYQPTTLYSGADSLAASISDPTGSLSASTSVPITVAPLNAPAIAAPGSGSLTENGSLTFSSANSNAISIADDAAGSNVDSVTLSATQGTVTLAALDGLTITSGTNGSSSFTVSGTVTDLNAALDGLVYQPTSLYSGSDTLSVSVADSGDTLSASTSVALTVTALSVPTTSATGSTSLTENGSLGSSSGSGTSSAFTDSATGSDSLSPSMTQATMPLSTATALSSTTGTYGSTTFTASSPVASVNSALSGVTFPGDALSSSPNASLTVNALATPAISTSLVFSSTNSSAISVIDAGAGSNSESLSLSHGRATLGPATGVSAITGTNVSTSLTTTGTVANLKEALNGLTSKPRATHVGSDSVSPSDSDRGDNLSAAPNVVFTVTALSGSTSLVAPPTTPLDQTGSLVSATSNGNPITSKAGAPGTRPDSLALSVAHGTITLTSATGLTFTTGMNGSASVTVSGSPANLNDDGPTDKVRVTHVASDSLSLADSDRGDSLSAATTVVFTVTALSAPALVAPPSGVLDQNGSLTFSTRNGNAISVFNFRGAAAESGWNSLTLSVAHGTISLASTTGLSFTRGMNGSASFTVMGTAANLNAALNGLVYQPTRSFSGSDSLVMSVSDPNGQSAGAKVALRVNVIAPTLTAPATGTVPGNGTLTFSKRAIRIADVNASTDIEQLMLTSSRGNFRLGSTNGITFVSGANNSGSMTISGTLTNLNAALNGLRFMPTTGFNGPGTISIKYTGARNGLSVWSNIAVTVGTSHASFGPSIPSLGPPIQLASHPSTDVFSPPQPTPSTIAETITAPNLSVILPPDDLARWDKFMAAMGLEDHS